MTGLSIADNIYRGCCHGRLESTSMAMLFKAAGKPVTELYMEAKETKLKVCHGCANRHLF